MEDSMAVSQRPNMKLTYSIAIWEGLTNSCEKKRNEKQRRKGKIKASECRVPENSKKR